MRPKRKAALFKTVTQRPNGFSAEDRKERLDDCLARGMPIALFKYRNGNRFNAKCEAKLSNDGYQ